MSAESLFRELEPLVKGVLMKNVLLSGYTTWQIGGPAEILFIPGSIVECSQALEIAGNQGVPVTFLGSGSNVLVADKGIEGLVIITRGLNNISWNGDHIKAEAGVFLPSICREAAEKGFSGLEFATGVPGTLGGAILMNAGTKYGFMEDIIEEVETLDTVGRKLTYPKEDISFFYRNSSFKNKSELIVQATLKLKRDSQENIKAAMADILEQRGEKQPLNYPNAGSVFKNPPGYSAGRLIEGVGAKGWRRGDAQVSEKHANFIVNLGEAKAAEVIELIKEVQRTVNEKYSVNLETEVVMLGFDNNGR